MNKLSAENIEFLADKVSVFDKRLPYPHNGLLWRTYYITGMKALVRYGGRLYIVHKLSDRGATIYSLPGDKKYRRDFTQDEARMLLNTATGSHERITEGPPEVGDKIEMWSPEGGTRVFRRVKFDGFMTDQDSKPDPKLEWVNLNIPVNFKNWIANTI